MCLRRKGIKVYTRKIATCIYDNRICYPFFLREGNTITVEQLRHIEGTVTLHINFAIKQDQELGKEFIKLLKKEGKALTTFNVALLLSIARMQRFEAQVSTMKVLHC